MRLETLQTFDRSNEVRKKVEIFSAFFNFFSTFVQLFFNFFYNFFKCDVRAVSHSCDVSNLFLILTAKLDWLLKAMAIEDESLEYLREIHFIVLDKG